MNITVVSRNPGITKAISSLQATSIQPKGKARDLRSMYFSLRDASRSHAYLRAAITSIGRSIIGPGYHLVKHPYYGDEATDEEFELLWRFYNNEGLIEAGVREIDVKHPLVARLYKTVGAFRLFGASFWEIRRTNRGEIVGAVPIDGYIHPNVDKNGKFLQPAWYQYINEVQKPAELDYEDVVAFMWPDYAGPAYATDIESLIEYTLSSDLYMLISIRELFKNMRTPFGIWSIDETVDKETYDEFVATIERLYQGAKNYGRSSITTKGQVSYKPVAQNVSDVPWREGHKMSRDETFAVTGQMPHKLGLEDISGSALQELRREYWEQTSLPLTRVLEEIMWQEIHVNLFGVRGWMLKFKAPDFTTALQDASIEMRRIQWGQWSPNDARVSRGDPPRDGGDYYLIPKNMDIQPSGEQGGAEDPVDAAGEEPNPSDEEPVPGSEPPERGDENEDVNRAISEFHRFLMSDVKRGKLRRRKFVSEHIPDKVIDAVLAVIDESGLTADIVNASIRGVKEWMGLC